MTELRLLKRGGDRFWVRRGTCDEEVLRARYARYRFLARGHRLSRDDVIVDLGAHIGAFAVTAARAAPGGHVHAIEPAAETYDLLARNLALNGLHNATPHQFAVSDRPGPATLYRGSDSWGDSIYRDGSGSGSGSERIETVTLDELLYERRIERVDYMKVNVEGAEYPILLGAAEETLRKVRHMLVEYHRSHDHHPSELVARLRGCGFTVLNCSAHSETGKGWLTATR
jgi:FkbM family methyltransferase